MPTLYIIAGPPGIGKSSNSSIFLPDGLPVLNHDLIRVAYKQQQLPDYGVKSNQKAWAFINEKSKSGADFGIELNLGFDQHYSLLTQIPYYYTSYTIHILLFFTDDLQLCLDRTAKRFDNGGHYVPEAVVKEMYAQTLSLLRKNISFFSHIQFFDVAHERLLPELVYSGYYPTANHEFTHAILPDWVGRHFSEILS